MVSSFADIVGYAAAVLGTICWIPQTIKAWTTRETKDLSLWANLLVFGTIAMWLLYGVLLNSWPMIVGNAISLIAISAIITAILRFKETEN